MNLARCQKSSQKSKKLFFKQNSKASKEKFAQKKENDEEEIKELMSLYKKKDYEGAINFATQLLTNHPKSVNTLYVMGLSACMLHNHELTISNFKKILEIDPLYKKKHVPLYKHCL